MFNILNHYIKDSPWYGKGVYASYAINVCEKILCFSGTRTHIDEIRDFTHYIQIGPDEFLSPSGMADDFVNHCCQPNSAVYLEGDSLVLRAIVPIEPHEEITFDYATIIFSEPTEFNCSCGKSVCRGKIGSFYSLAKSLQKKFISLNHVPLLNKYSIEELRESRKEMA